MPAPISVIIPTLNSAQHLQRSLGALGEGIMDGLLAEVIFADGGSTDDTEQIAQEIGATFIPTKKGRGNQMAQAAKQARGEWMLFLHSDSILDRDWQSAIVQHLARPEKAAYFKLRFDEDSLAAKIVSTWTNFRARWFGLPYGDQGMLIHKRLYKSVGGFPETPLMEDVAMARLLHGNLVPLPVVIETSAEKYRKNGWFKQSLSNFGLMFRYFIGANPIDLAAKYYR